MPSATHGLPQATSLYNAGGSSHARCELYSSLQLLTSAHRQCSTALQLYSALHSTSSTSSLRLCTVAPLHARSGPTMHRQSISRSKSATGRSSSAPHSCPKSQANARADEAADALVALEGGGGQEAAEDRARAPVSFPQELSMLQERPSPVRPHRHGLWHGTKPGNANISRPKIFDWTRPQAPP